MNNPPPLNFRQQARGTKHMNTDLCILAHVDVCPSAYNISRKHAYVCKHTHPYIQAYLHIGILKNTEDIHSCGHACMHATFLPPCLLPLQPVGLVTVLPMTNDPSAVHISAQP